MKFIDYCHLVYLIWYFFQVCCIVVHMRQWWRKWVLWSFIVLWNSKGKEKRSKIFLGTQDVSSSCCILASLLLLQSKLHRAPGAGRSSSWGRTVSASLPDHTYASSEVKQFQHQPKLQKYLALLRSLSHRQTRTCRSSAFFSWPQCTSLESEGQHEISADSTGHEFMPAQTHLLFAQFQSST